MSNKEQRLKKLGCVLKNTCPSSQSIANCPKRVIPLYIEEPSSIFERHRIIKSHLIFKNEIKNNYTNNYMDNVSELLFQNDKNYYKKRNQLAISNPTLPELSYKKYSHTPKSSTSNLSISSLRSNSVAPHNKVYYSKDYLVESCLKTRHPNRLVEIEVMSNKMNKVYCKNFKKLLLRRIEGIRDIHIPTSPCEEEKIYTPINTTISFRHSAISTNCINKTSKFILRTPHKKVSLKVQ